MRGHRLGPGNIGGRTRVVKFHPTIPTTLFAAGVSGGIWKSDDNGTTWRPTGDGLTNIAVNSLLIDPARPDVMYAGTGEGYFREEVRGTGLPLRGSGIYVTTDGARSWQQLPATNTPDFHWVNDLEFGVNDSRRIYAATRSGVWRSTDSGATWARLLAVDVRGGCLDLALRPDRSEDVLFASCGSYEQATVYRFPRAADRSDAEVVLREPDMGRTSLAIAPSNPDVMYALAASNAPGPQGIYEQGLLAVYRSDRGGTAGSWETRVNNHDPTFLNTMLLTNTVERGGARLQSAGLKRAAGGDGVVQQRDRGRSARSRIASGRPASTGSDPMTADRNWGLASFGYGSGQPSFYAHADQHAITFHPNYDGEGNQIALIGNDGGIYRTTNARAATSNGPQAACTGGQPIQVAWTSLNRGYGVTQFYHGTPFPDGTQYLAGAQDNNTLLGSDAAGPDGWRPVFGGDGGFSAVHPTQTSTLADGISVGQPRPHDQRRSHHFASANRPRSDLREQYRPGSQLPVHRAVHARSGNQQHLAGRQLPVSRARSFGLSGSKVPGSRCPTAAASARLRCRHATPRYVRDRHRSAVTSLAWSTAAARPSPRSRSHHSPRSGWVTSIAVRSA